MCNLFTGELNFIRRQTHTRDRKKANKLNQLIGTEYDAKQCGMSTSLRQLKTTTTTKNRYQMIVQSTNTHTHTKMGTRLTSVILAQMQTNLGDSVIKARSKQKITEKQWRITIEKKAEVMTMMTTASSTSTTTIKQRDA